jgi:hypothetical protein
MVIHLDQLLCVLCEVRNEVPFSISWTSVPQPSFWTWTLQCLPQPHTRYTDDDKWANMTQHHVMWLASVTSLRAAMSWNVFRSVSASNHNHYYFGKERKMQITVEKPVENTLFNVYSTQFPVIWTEAKIYIYTRIWWPNVLEIRIVKYYLIKITWTQ